MTTKIKTGFYKRDYVAVANGFKGVICIKMPKGWASYRCKITRLNISDALSDADFEIRCHKGAN